MLGVEPGEETAEKGAHFLECCACSGGRARLERGDDLNVSHDVRSVPQEAVSVRMNARALLSV